jgi:hypothetical protein
VWRRSRRARTCWPARRLDIRRALATSVDRTAPVADAPGRCIGSPHAVAVGVASRAGRLDPLSRGAGGRSLEPPRIALFATHDRQFGTAWRVSSPRFACRSFSLDQPRRAQLTPAVARMPARPRCSGTANSRGVSSNIAGILSAEFGAGVLIVANLGGLAKMLPIGPARSDTTLVDGRPHSSRPRPSACRSP